MPDKPPNEHDAPGHATPGCTYCMRRRVIAGAMYQGTGQGDWDIAGRIVQAVWVKAATPVMEMMEMEHEQARAMEREDIVRVMRDQAVINDEEAEAAKKELPGYALSGKVSAIMFMAAADVIEEMERATIAANNPENSNQQAEPERLIPDEDLAALKPAGRA